MQSAFVIHTQCITQKRLRIDQAAAILERAPRTIRYHILTGSLHLTGGFIAADEVYALRDYLARYYRKPFQPGSRSGRRKGGNQPCCVAS